MSRRRHTLHFALVVSLSIVCAVAGHDLMAKADQDRLAKEAPLSENEPDQHPLDVALERETCDLGPSAATAEIYAAYEEKWDAELNKIYKLWMSELSPAEGKLLREGQRAWISARDADKRILDMAVYQRSEGFPPSMYVSFHAYAVMNLTRQRALALTKWRELQRDLKSEREDAAGGGSTQSSNMVFARPAENLPAPTISRSKSVL